MQVDCNFINLHENPIVNKMMETNNLELKVITYKLDAIFNPFTYNLDLLESMLFYTYIVFETSSSIQKILYDLYFFPTKHFYLGKLHFTCNINAKFMLASAAMDFQSHNYSRTIVIT